MSQLHRFSLPFAALAVLLLGVYGCGASSAPPPGAPKDASEPTVKQGEEEQADVASSDEATEEHAETAESTTDAAEATELAANTDTSKDESKTAAATGDWGTLTGRIVYEGKAPSRSPSTPPRTPPARRR